jgi:hypothetical protein
MVFITKIDCAFTEVPFYSAIRKKNCGRATVTASSIRMISTITLQPIKNVCELLEHNKINAY